MWLLGHSEQTAFQFSKALAVRRLGGVCLKSPLQGCADAEQPMANYVELTSGPRACGARETHRNRDLSDRSAASAPGASALRARARSTRAAAKSGRSRCPARTQIRDRPK